MADGLTIAGLGGSNKIFCTGKDGTQNPEEIWHKGTYPYETEEKFVADLGKLAA